MKQSIWRAGLALSLALATVLVTVGTTQVDPFIAASNSSIARAAGANFPNCRLGIGVTKNSFTTYNFTPTHIGWYMDWNAQMVPPEPGGVEYYFTVRIKQDKVGSTFLDTVQITPPLTDAPGGLGPIVRANPGRVWILGNEIDRRGQNETLPDKYAEAYHDVYQFVKGIDPTAKIAIGSVVEPTPLRLQYLDMILNAYRNQYGEPLPIDIWNIHLYILPELLGSWGAEVPPGITATTGRIYSAPDSINIDIFKSLTSEMRTWMKARGYQDKPLIVTEFGAILPLWWLGQFGITEQNMAQFNGAAVNYLNSAMDPSLGYAGDSNRLVQRSALYSMDDDTPLPGGLPGEFAWGTFLFRSSSPFTMTSMGQYYLNQIAAPLTPTLDLYPYRYRTEPASMIVAVSQTVTTTLRVSIANAGNTWTMAGTPQSTTVRVTDVTGGRNAVLGERPLSPPGGCGSSTEISITWPGLTSGVHLARIEVDPGNLVLETTKSNNTMTATVLVGNYGIYLPLVSR